MSESLRVLLYGQLVANLIRNGKDLRLRYTDEYRRSSDPTPISLSMPVISPDHPTSIVEPWLWGLLPDNQEVLKRWSQDYQVSASNVFALLSHVGEDCAGAVQFVCPDRIDSRAPGDVQWLTEQEIADLLSQLRIDPTAWHAAGATAQFSLAGAQPKTALHFDGQRWGLPTGSTPTTHILKPALTGLDDHDLNEHLCLRTARYLNLDAAKSEVRRFGSEGALVVERYDRLPIHDGYSRIHQEDLCQALAVHPDKKYQSDGGPSPAQISTLFRATTGRRAAIRLTQHFIDGLAFNWLIAGPDAHAKNYSLLLKGREIALAPLYDVASILPYDNFDIHKLRLAMKIGGEYKLAWISRENWARLAVEVGLPPAVVIARVADLATRLPDALDRACTDPALEELGSALPATLRDRVSERAAACLQRLGPPEAVRVKSRGTNTVDTGNGAQATPETGVEWTTETARQLIGALAAPQVALIKALTVHEGELSAAAVRAAIGRDPHSSLRGSTGPITKAIRHLGKRGNIDPELGNPIETVYAKSVKAEGFRMTPGAQNAFREAFEQ